MAFGGRATNRRNPQEEYLKVVVVFDLGPGVKKVQSKGHVGVGGKGNAKGEKLGEVG